MANQVTGLVATAVSSSEIDLYWDDVATLYDEVYDVERDSVIVGNDYAGTHTIGSPYQDTGLSPGTAYTYRVRAVGFDPTLDVAGLVGWYNFSDISTLWKDTGLTTPVTADGDIILGVTDRSGSGKTLTVAANGPAYKTGIINSKAGARFDGTNDILSNTAITGDASTTNFIVAKKVGAVTASSDAIWAQSNTTQIHTNSTSGTGYHWFSNEAAGTAVNVIAVTPTSPNILIMQQVSAASMNFYGNGGSPTNIDPSGAGTGTTILIGASAAGTNHGDYDVGEILRYNSALSAADINLVGNYLGTRWGITWTTVP